VKLGRIIILAIAVTAGARAAQDPADRLVDLQQELRRDLEALTAQRPRLAGYEACRRAEAYIRDQLRQAGFQHVWSQPLEVTQPVTDLQQTRLYLPDGQSWPIYPCWPNGANIAATSREGIQARALYIGEGRLSELPVDKLPGSIAVMEFNSGRRWHFAAMYGAAAVVFLPPKETTWRQAHEKFVPLSINLPRFYVNDPQLADILRHPPAEPVRVVSRVRWRRLVAYNVIGYLPGADPNLADKFVVLQASYDAMAVVPDLAVGAEQAVSASVLLHLARHFAQARPRPPYSMVFVFSGADGLALSGAQHALRVLTGDKGVLEGKANALAEAIETLRKNRAAADAPDLVAKLKDSEYRQLRDEFIERQIKRKLAEYLDRLVDLRRELEDVQNELARKDLPTERRKALQARLAELTEPDTGLIPELSKRRASLTAFRVKLHHGRLSTKDLAVIEPFLPAVRQRMDSLLRDYERRLAWYQQDIDMLGVLGLGGPNDYKDRLVICSIALSSHGRRFGPLGDSYYAGKSHQQHIVPYGRRLRELALRSELPEAIRSTYLTETTTGRRDWHSYLPFHLVTGVDAATAGGVLGLLFVTTDDMRAYVDTPLDTLDRVELRNVTPQAAMLETMIERAMQDPDLIVSSKLRHTYVDFDGLVAIKSPGESQIDLGISDAVVLMRPIWIWLRPIGMRDSLVRITDAEGQFRFESIMGRDARWMPMRFEAYVFDDDGRVVMALDRGSNAQILAGMWDRGATATNWKGSLFDCVQIPIFGLHDPRYLEDLGAIIPLDAARGDQPRYVSALAEFGQCSLCLPDDLERWQLLAAYGKAGRRMILTNSTDADPEGIGYPLGERFTWPPAMLAAVDFSRLNHARIVELQSRGVINKYIEEQEARARRLARQAEAARAAGDGANVWRYANRALALAAQVYTQLRHEADDTVHAVIFLMLVLAPFSYFAERLLIGAVNVYRQIAGFTVVFAVMVAVLWAFHPAFRLSMAPLTIVLAFLILLLSSVVIWIVVGKFRTEIRHARGERDDQMADFKRSDVLHRAMLLGISNMRRRRMRTALTLITLILVTFVILSFTSARTQLRPIRFQISRARAPFDGIMVQRIKWKPLPTWAVDHFQTKYHDRATVTGHYWLTFMNENSQTEIQLYLFAGERPERSAGILTAVGIEPAEARAMHLAGTLAAGDLDTFLQREDALLISQTTAKQLGVQPGQQVSFFGRRFVVAGILDDRRIRQRTYQNGQTYAPVDFLRMPKLTGQEQEAEARLEAEMDVSELSEGESYFSLPPAKFAIVRARRAVELGATLRAVLIIPNDSSQVTAMADALAEELRRPIYAGQDGVIRLCAAATYTGLQGIGNVAVPLVISAMIILNTMLNCVYERHREISVFMALGLAPTHVGALFVAEAAAFGTLGIVAGYILGQGIGTLISRYELIAGLTLNYSSLAAIYTMMMVMAVVLCSSIWPARVASRVAAPSVERTWRLPAPVNDTITMELPFTVNRAMAEGILAYLHEWLGAHTETTLGRFSTGAVEPYAEPATGARGLVAQIWLAPFDLGIMQTMQLEVRPTDEPDIYSVHISLRREAGQEVSWLRSNRLFLVELRKQFLLWRSLSEQKRGHYIELSGELFAQAGAQTEPAGAVT